MVKTGNSEEARMFWELLDERGGEAECAFFVYCSRVFLAIANTEMSAAGWRPAPHVSGGGGTGDASADGFENNLEEEDEEEEDFPSDEEGEGGDAANADSSLGPLGELAGNWPKEELKRVPDVLLLPAPTVYEAVAQIMKRATPDAREDVKVALSQRVVARPQRVDGKTIDTPWIDVGKFFSFYTMTEYSTIVMP
tara:strand:+ start:173 stop:757 length:585 start_codon:yes stop_codon:yes gene_type:complete